MKMKEKKQNEATEKIAVLLFTIMQPAIAGGMPLKEAEEIYDKILSNICKLHSSQHQFDILLQEILNNWAIPVIKEYGITNNLLERVCMN